VRGACIDREWSNRVTQPLALPDSNYTWDTDTVTDHVTGLVWQRVVDSTGRTWPDGGNYSTGRTWTDAGNYCTNLPLAGGGWRLPTKNELLSIADYGLFPAINQNAFPNTPPEGFWSSTVRECGSSGAWVVNFYGGGAYGHGVGDSSRVRCVR